MKHIKLFEEFEEDPLDEKWYHNLVMGAAALAGSIGNPTNSFANSEPSKPNTEIRSSTEKNSGIDAALTIQKTHTGDNLLCFDFVYKIISMITKTSNKSLRKNMAVTLKSSGDMKLLEAIENGNPSTRGVQFALEKAGMGHAVTRAEVKAGDFVQFWHRELHMKHMYDAVKRTADEKEGKQVAERVYIYRNSTDQYFVRKDIKTPIYTSITLDAAKKMAKTKAVELVDFDIWGHSAMVSNVGKDGTVYLAGSGHEKGFSGVIFGEDSSWNKISPNDPNLVNAYFVRLNTAPTQVASR